MRLAQIGVESENCEIPNCPKYNCYEPCEHQSIVYSKLDIRPYRTQEFLTALINGILIAQEELIKAICAEDEITQIGFELGVPHFVCGFAEIIETESEELVNCSLSKVVTWETVNWIDLSTPPYLSVYTSLLDWISVNRGVANYETLESYFDLFGMSLVGFKQGYYAVDISESGYQNILPFIQQYAPLPFGAFLSFYS